MSVCQFGSELTENRGYGAQTHFKFLADALGLKPHERITSYLTGKVFENLDADGSNAMDLEELSAWAKEKKVFGDEVDDDFIHNTCARLYRDSGAAASGMTKSQFHTFIVGIQREDKQLTYAARHHLMQMPPSMQKANKTKFTLEAIETELHNKIRQNTCRDSDRARNIATIFKKQLQRDSGEVDTEDAGNETLSINKKQFRSVLNLLGLFATPEQADILFRKYDVNGDGDLTIHEFLTQAYPDDYPGMAPLDESRYYDFRLGGAGKRLFPDEGIGARPKTPHHQVFQLNIKQIHKTLKLQIEKRHRSGLACSIPYCRRQLANAFESEDQQQHGKVNRESLQKVFENRFGMNYGSNQYQELMETYEYEGEPGYFDYVKFCLSVFSVEEQEKTILTSLVNNSPNSAHVREAKTAAIKAAKSPSNRRSVHRPSGADPSLSQVHTTGFYYKPRSPTNASVPPVNFAAAEAAPASRMQSSRLQHQMRMMSSSRSQKSLGKKDEGDWRTPILP